MRSYSFLPFNNNEQFKDSLAIKHLHTNKYKFWRKLNAQIKIKCANKVITFKYTWWCLIPFCHPTIMKKNMHPNLKLTISGLFDHLLFKKIEYPYLVKMFKYNHHAHIYLLMFDFFLPCKWQSWSSTSTGHGRTPLCLSQWLNPWNLPLLLDSILEKSYKTNLFCQWWGGKICYRKHGRDW